MRFVCELSWEYCVSGFALYQLKMNFLRYYPIAGLAFLVFWVWKKDLFQKFRIQKDFPKKERIIFELKQSAVTLIMFCVIAVSVYVLGKLKILHIKTYKDFTEYGLGYAIFSFVLLTIWHETWFYWAHRIMHHRKIYPYIHSVHHRSVNPSPMAAYNFHWVEAFIEGVYVVPALCILPLHFYVFLIHTFYAMIMNIWWHLGYEFFPKGWTTHPLLKWINTSTHHNLHHQKFHGNYSLYFNFWDKIMGTNFKDYSEIFENSVGAEKKEGISVIPSTYL
ncbi:sterol desaturase family protein [Leptospira selangorensis]|uniref:Sterol desaturase family protein n=1 Tax=Leptospira selangorensis TaxID=2484982 RepID=A0A5F2BWC4_9LEPT|nr:sterol desaturase family protein [Leptospira selangorensis]TGM13183.1 sterol desaturase family protein [Leptospira selangorensis]TGM15351.1 sterol desaturase family protein [Leptospira selangorensis]